MKDETYNINPLILMNAYRFALKDCVDTTAHHVEQEYVLFRYNEIVELLGIFQLKSLKPFRKAALMDLGKKPENVLVLPIGICYVPTDNQYKKLGNVFYSSVKKTIAKNKFDFNIIHAHFTWPQGYAGARLKEVYGVPFVVTGHGYDVYSLPFRDDEWRAKIEFVLDTADHVITVSQSNLACIKKLDVSTPVTVIPNGFRSDLFSPRDTSECRKMLNLPQDRKIILTVGNLEPVKGQKYLVEAIQKITQERKDILCVIVGAGKLRLALERQIRLLGLEDSIILAGGKPHDEIPLWMNACDLFVLPSLNEGNPTVMFEALGCGKPFVGTRVGGVPEVITSDEYGLLVDPADPEDLAEKILVALDREWNREAILRYAERYTWENIAKEIMGVYEQVLG
jgi:glycosyltransferase involved in cell wall biosynthesis